MKYLSNLRVVLVLFLLSISANLFAAGDATLGQPLFEGKTKPGMGCLGSNCHGVTAFQNTNKICSGTTNAGIMTGINNVADMASLKAFFGVGLLTGIDIDNIAAYIASKCAPAAVPIATLTPITGLAFGDQQIGTISATQLLTLKNTGTGVLNIGGIASSSTEFIQTNACGASLAAGLSCTISVNFKPTTLGAKSATISVTDNAAGSPHSVPLSGNGLAVPAPAITLTPNTGLAFGNVTVGSTSAAQTVTLKNTGNANLTLTTISIGGTNGVDFAKVGTCANGATIAANGTCTIAITFAPSAMGTRSGSVAITSNAPTANIALSGSGVAVPTPQVSLTPLSLAFGNQVVNITSAAKAITLTNSGNAALSISNIAASAEFAQSNNCGASLGAGLSCTINVTFTPTTVASKAGSVTITNNASGSPHTISLTGSGIAVPAPAVGPLPASLNFGSLQISTTSAAQTVTVSNTGSAALVLSSIALSGDFAKSGGTCVTGGSVAAAASCTILVTFTPTIVGARTGNLTIADNATGSPRTIALTGTGTSVPLPTATLLPVKLTFPNQTINTTSAAKSATLKNTSASAALNISGVTIGGANASDFAKTNCPATLAAGASCVISVTFTPTVAALRTASLSVASNASGVLTTGLEGTGTAVAAPQASLSPTSLTFGSQTVNVTSAAQTVTLSNTGNAALTISSVAVTGEFAKSSGTCVNGGSVAAGANCTVLLTFTPTTAAVRSGDLTIVTNASGSPHKVTLSGTGAVTPAPQLKLLPSSLSLLFANQNVGSQSTVQSITLENIGVGVMQLKSITIGGTHATDFGLVSGCGTSLAPAATCTVNVYFKPTVAGSRSASVDISSDAGDGKDSVTLGGTGTSSAGGTPILTIPTVKLEVETTSGGATVVDLEILLKNTGTADLQLGIIKVKKGDSFSVVSNACGTVLAPGNQCSIKIRFAPTVAGEHIDELEVNNASDGKTELVELKGQAAAAAVNTSGTAATTGGGCVMSANGQSDPTPIALLLLASFGLALRTRRN